MGRYVVRRILQGLLTLFVTLFIVHYLMSLAIQINGNPALTFFGEQSRPTETQIEAVEKMFGTDDPCFEQTGNPCINVFVQRLGNLSSGDLGVDYGQRDVGELLSAALPNTLKLFAVTTAVWLIIGIGMGVVAALRRDKFADHATRVISVLLTAFPTFLTALLLQGLLGVFLGNKVRKEFGDDHFFSLVLRPTFDESNAWTTLIIPGLIVGALGVAGLSRLMRTSLLENLKSDFVRTARAKGLPNRRVLWIHTIRNSLIPVVTMIGMSFGGAIGGAVITETVFNIRGVGLLMINATRRNDMSIVITVVTLSIALIIIINLIVDLLYAALDPRIRYE